MSEPNNPATTASVESASAQDFVDVPRVVREEGVFAHVRYPRSFLSSWGGGDLTDKPATRWWLALVTRPHTAAVQPPPEVVAEGHLSAFGWSRASLLVFSYTPGHGWGPLTELWLRLFVSGSTEGICKTTRDTMLAYRAPASALVAQLDYAALEQRVAARASALGEDACQSLLAAEDAQRRIDEGMARQHDKMVAEEDRMGDWLAYAASAIAGRFGLDADQVELAMNQAGITAERLVDPECRYSTPFAGLNPKHGCCAVDLEARSDAILSWRADEEGTTVHYHDGTTAAFPVSRIGHIPEAQGPSRARGLANLTVLPDDPTEPP